VIKALCSNLIHWRWTKALLYWIILSAGTMSELAFLIASLWVTINASVHRLVLVFVPETVAFHLTELATAAYVVLPEAILCLACVTTISHLKTWFYERSLTALLWAFLYGLPTLVFLVLSLITLGFSVLSVTFTLPQPLVVVRALAGFVYAFVALLYWQLGHEQEADRLSKRDLKNAELEKNIQRLTDLIARQKLEFELLIAREREVLNQDLENLKAENESLKKRNHEIFSVKNEGDESALQALSPKVLAWLNTGSKTTNVEEINLVTGRSKNQILYAIKTGKLRHAPRNEKLMLKTSVKDWLLKTPRLVNDDVDTPPSLHAI
jgi:hypothetical protein